MMFLCEMQEKISCFFVVFTRHSGLAIRTFVRYFVGLNVPVAMYESVSLIVVAQHEE